MDQPAWPVTILHYSPENIRRVNPIDPPDAGAESPTKGPKGTTMAAKKNAAAEEAVLQAEEKPAEGKPEATEEPAKVNKWDIMETVMTPRKSKHDYYYVCVNDRRFEIPADGKAHEMPHPIAEVLRQTIEAENAAMDYAESIPNRGAQ